MIRLRFWFMTDSGQSTKMIMSVALTKSLMWSSNRRSTTGKSRNHDGALWEYSLKVRREGFRGRAVRNSKPNNGDDTGKS
jgi:hypothetical protein